MNFTPHACMHAHKITIHCVDHIFAYVYTLYCFCISDMKHECDSDIETSDIGAPSKREPKSDDIA